MKSLLYYIVLWNLTSPCINKFYRHDLCFYSIPNLLLFYLTFVIQDKSITVNLSTNTSIWIFNRASIELSKKLRPFNLIVSKKLSQATWHPAFYLWLTSLHGNQVLIKASKREKEGSVNDYSSLLYFYDDINTNLSILHVKAKQLSKYGKRFSI